MNEPGELLEIGGHKARVVQRGDGPAVVVLHGWGGRIESMWPIVDCLAPSFRVVAVDLPGFGQSPAPNGVWGTADYAHYVTDLLTFLDVGRAHYIGHSFGAKTSLYIAASHAERVDKLVLIGSSGLTSPPTMKVRAKRVVSKVARAVGRLGPPGDKLREAVYRRIASQDYKDAGALRPIMVKVVNEDLTYLLPRIKASTLLVWGTDDDAVPVAHARKMESLIPDAGLVLFEGAGHFAYLDEPARFCRITSHFLEARSR